MHYGLSSFRWEFCGFGMYLVEFIHGQTPLVLNSIGLLFVFVIHVLKQNPSSMEQIPSLPYNYKGVIWIHPHRSEISEAAFPDIVIPEDKATYLQSDRLEILPILLKTWFDVSKAHNLTSWIEAGSLLSVVRDDGLIIPWDSDIDIGVTEHDFDEFLNKTANNPNVFDQNHFHWIIKQDKQMARLAHLPTAFYVDIFVRTWNDTIARWTHPIVGNMPNDVLFPLNKSEDILLANISVVIPHSPWKYLNILYGDGDVVPRMEHKLLLHSVRSASSILIFSGNLMVLLLFSIHLRRRTAGLMSNRNITLIVNYAVCFITLVIAISHSWHLNGYYLILLFFNALANWFLICLFIHSTPLLVCCSSPSSSKYSLFWSYQLLVIAMCLWNFFLLIRGDSIREFRSFSCAVPGSVYC